MEEQRNKNQKYNHEQKNVIRNENETKKVIALHIKQQQQQHHY